MKYIAILLLLTLSPLYAKVLIITHSFNRPDFIEIHAKTFKSFLQDEYEYVVFNDAPDNAMKRQIELTCKRLGIRCFRVPQELHSRPGRSSASCRHMDGIQFALNTIALGHAGIVTLIDSDMFLLKPFSIEKYMEQYDISGALQGRSDAHHSVFYLSPILVFMNMQTLPHKETLNFEGGYVEGLACDVGGHTYYYFKDNPCVKAKHFGVLHVGSFISSLNCKACTNLTCVNCVNTLRSNRFNEKTIDFIHSCHNNIEFFLDHTFLHYRGGSNWDNQSPQYHTAKTNAFNTYLAACFLEHSR